MQKDLKDLLIDELHDILSAEEQIVKALPAMVTASESPDLKKAFGAHLKETKGQVRRLAKVFKLLKVKKQKKFCKAMHGLIEECKEVLKDYKVKSPVRDAAFISKAQRIEHYEIAAYGTVYTFANELGFDAVADLLQETLDEEGNADKKLTKIAEGGFFKKGINIKANEPKTTKLKQPKKKAAAPKKAPKKTPTKTKSKRKSK